MVSGALLLDGRRTLWIRARRCASWESFQAPKPRQFIRCHCRGGKSGAWNARSGVRFSTGRGAPRASGWR